MNFETLKMTQEIQKRNCELILEMDPNLEGDEIQRLVNENERLQRIEISERDMMTKEAQHVLEADKFEYQKEQDARNAICQRNRTLIDNVAAVTHELWNGAWNFVVIPRIFNWGMGYEQTNAIASKTFRGFYSELLRPKLR